MEHSGAQRAGGKGKGGNGREDCENATSSLFAHPVSFIGRRGASTVPVYNALSHCARRAISPPPRPPRPSVKRRRLLTCLARHDSPLPLPLVHGNGTTEELGEFFCREFSRRNQSEKRSKLIRENRERSSRVISMTTRRCHFAGYTRTVRVQRNRNKFTFRHRNTPERSSVVLATPFHLSHANFASCSLIRLSWIGKREPRYAFLHDRPCRAA